MQSPLSLITRAARPRRLAPPIGRCPVCHEPIRNRESVLTLRGGVHVHTACATYRTRQRAHRI